MLGLPSRKEVRLVHEKKEVRNNREEGFPVTSVVIIKHLVLFLNPSAHMCGHVCVHVWSIPAMDLCPVYVVLYFCRRS